MSLILSRADALDGVVAAALLRRWGGHLQDQELRFAPPYVQQKVFQEVLADQRTIDDTNVFVLGIEANGLLTGALEGNGSILEAMRKRAKSVTWVDHHFGTGQALRYLRNRGINVITDIGPWNRKQFLCTSMLLYNKIREWSDELTRGSDPFSESLAALAQVHEYPRESHPTTVIETAKQLQRVITYLNFADNVDDEKSLQRMTDILAYEDWLQGGKIHHPYLNSLLDVHDQEIREQDLWRRFGKSISKGGLFGKSILIAHAPSLLPASEVIDFLEEYYGDRHIYAFFVIHSSPQSHVMVFAPPNSDFNVMDFCHRMKGSSYSKRGTFPLGIHNSTDRSNGLINKVIEQSLRDYMTEGYHHV